MTTYAELLEDKAKYRAARDKALQAQEYSMGSGGTARRLVRSPLGEIEAKLEKLNAQIDAHPDNPARTRRRVYTLRPAC